MQGEIYFQWQNDFLRKSIYPLREMKLRDFLVAYFEIDLWARYKNLQPEKLEQEAQEYKQNQSKLRKVYYEQYLEHRQYFLTPDVGSHYKSKFSEVDSGVITSINRIHKAFADFFPKYQNTAKERYFLIARTEELERERKRYQDELPRIQRNLINMGETWVHRQRELNRKALLENIILKMLDEELTRLAGFNLAMARVEKRRQQMLKWLQDIRKTRDDLALKLQRSTAQLPFLEKKLRDRPTPELEKQVAQLEAEIKALELQRSLIETQLHQDEQVLVEENTTIPDVTKEDIVRGKIEAYRDELSQKNHIELLELVVRRFLDDPSRYPLWLQYMVVHFSGMRYQSAHGSWADPRDLLVALTEKAVEREIQSADDQAIEALSKEKILQYAGELTPPSLPNLNLDQPIQLPRLAMTTQGKWKTTAQDHLRRLKYYNLRLRINPSDAKPVAVLFKNLNGSLVDSGQSLHKGLEIIVDPFPIQKEQEYYRIELFPGNPALAGLFAASQDVSLVPNPYKRKALMDLRIAEETYKIEEEFTDRQVLDELSLMRTRLDLPSWMWNEIVKLTELRLHTTQENWENTALTPLEMEQRYSYQYRAYSALLNKWQQAHLTGWREEHNRSNRLVVTRAVCNEVAEHIQHLRGHNPPGGLTAKPAWYRRKEKDPGSSALNEKPFFVKARFAADFKPGASLFWLGFVPKEPNAWQVSHPLVLHNGEGLLTPDIKVSNGSNDGSGTRFDPSKVTAIRSTSNWSYYQIPDGRYKRSRSIKDQNDKSYRDDNWMRWLHEATVIEVAETVDGPTVLTFETALPYEDRRRSTIGLFKHTLNQLLYQATPTYFNGTFVGYVPEAELPLADLQEMLDWNKILLKPDFISPGQRHVNWTKATGVDLPLSFSTPIPGQTGQKTGLIQAEVAPLPMQKNGEHQESISCYEVDKSTSRAALYQPDIESMCFTLRRGARIMTNRSEAVTIGGDTYLPILQCEDEPLAQDFYLRSTEVIDAPPNQANQPALTRAPASLFTISHFSPDGIPIFIPYRNKAGQDLQLPSGSCLLLSGVHRLSSRDSGNGAIQAADQQVYHLVIECPSRGAAQGLFIRTDQVTRITLDEYLSSNPDGPTKKPDKICVILTPKDNSRTVNLYKKNGAEPKLVENIPLPANPELWVAPTPEFTRSGEYYRILEFPGSSRHAGCYLNVDDTTLKMTSKEP